MRPQQRSFYHTPESPKTIWLRVLIIASCVLCLFLGGLAFNRYFRVVRIICTENDSDCSQETLTVISGLKGRSLFSKLAPTLLGKKVYITKKYPQTIQVVVEPQETLLHVFLDENKQSSAVIYTDATVVKEPTVVPLSSDSGKIAITDLTLAQNVDTSVLSQASLDVYTELLEFSKTQPITEIIIRSSDEIEVRTSKNLTALLSAHGIQSQLHSLQLILGSPTIEQKPARVDLRFDRPVLQYY